MNNTDTKNIIIKNNLSIWELEPINSSNEELYLSYYNNECLTSLKFHSVFLLDKNKEKYDFIEKLVYDLSLFHLKNMNLVIDENIEIEFWFKTSGTYDDRAVHIDEDVYSKDMGKLTQSPILSIILCFNDNNNPVFISNINEESYKYKNFTEENKNLCIIFPKKMRNIVFDGGYYHSEINIFNYDINIFQRELRNMLVINIWHNYKPIKIPIYNSEKYKHHNYNKCEDSNYLFKKNNIIKNISLNESDKILNKDFFSELLYNNNTNFNFLSKIFNKEDIYQGLYIINETNIDTNIDIKEHPLKKLYINYKNIDWIGKISILPNKINESEINNIINQFTTYGELIYTDKLFSYVINNISTHIFESIKNCFELNNTYNINIEKIMLTNEISTNFNTTIIASLILKDDIIFTSINQDKNREEIEIKKGTLVIQNNEYKNKNMNDQIILEFFINIETV
jgi:hypothetical protein